MVVTGVGRTEYVDGISAVAEAGVVIAEEGTAGHLVGADGVEAIGDAVAHGRVNDITVVEPPFCFRLFNTLRDVGDETLVEEQDIIFAGFDGVNGH